MKVQWVGIGKVKAYARNPRRRSEDSIRKIADSIAAFGWQQPIVVDKKFVIIIGQGRLEAARLLEMKQVPVVVARKLAPEKVKALRLADNRTNRDSDWDINLLAQEIEELRDLDMQLITQAGFTEDDLKRIADDVDESVLERIASLEGEGRGDGGGAPGAEGGGVEGDDLVTFSEVLSVEQRKVVDAAIELAKQREGLGQRGAALFHICKVYLEGKRRC